MILRSEIRKRRLRAHLLKDSSAQNPIDVLRHMGPMQAQDFDASLWAVGLRAVDCVVEDVLDAIASGAIVRSWPLRGTLHLVAASDLRWILDVTAQRVISQAAGRYRQLELDAAVFARARKVVASALQGGTRLDRGELRVRLSNAGVDPSGQRLYHILNRLGLEAMICFGPPREHQPTFVLVDDWVPASPAILRDVALGRLAERYFASRGPATLRDFAWWSGLTMRDARTGAESVDPELVVDPGMTGNAEPEPRRAGTAVLLPAFDEFVLAYRDRGIVVAPERARELVSANGMFWPTVIVDGQVVARWRAAESAAANTVELERRFDDQELDLSAAIERYRRFQGLTVGS